MAKINILFLYPGPVWFPESDSFQRRFLKFGDYFNGYVVSISGVERKFRIHNFSFDFCKLSKNFSRFKFIIFCLFSIIKQNKCKKFDCIVVYDPLFTGIVAVFFKLLFKCKLIVEVNGIYDARENWFDDKKIIYNEIKILLAPIIMNIVLYFSDGVKLLFNNQVNFNKKLYNKKIIKVFPSYVPVQNFVNICENKEILFIGHPYYRKGVDVLIKSFIKIQSDHPDWSLKILGWFPDMTELDSAIGCNERITHHPPVSPSEIIEHIGQCGIFVLPSRSEAMGRVLIEAAAAGKPRIGANVGGIPTVITDGVDGFLFESENSDQLAAILSKLIRDSNLRSEIGKRAFERAICEFDETSFVNKYVSFIQEVMD